MAFTVQSRCMLRSILRCARACTVGDALLNMFSIQWHRRAGGMYAVEGVAMHYVVARAGPTELLLSRPDDVLKDSNRLVAVNGRQR